MCGRVRSGAPGRRHSRGRLCGDYVQAAPAGGASTETPGSARPSACPVRLSALRHALGLAGRNPGGVGVRHPGPGLTYRPRNYLRPTLDLATPVGAAAFGFGVGWHPLRGPRGFRFVKGVPDIPIMLGYLICCTLRPTEPPMACSSPEHKLTGHCIWHIHPGIRVEAIPLPELWVALRVPAPAVTSVLSSPWARKLPKVPRTRSRAMMAQKAYRRAGLLGSEGPHRGLGVVPPSWPSEVDEILAPLRSAPTPYEVACRLLEPRGWPRRPVDVDLETWNCARATVWGWFTHGSTPHTLSEGCVPLYEALPLFLQAFLSDPATSPWAYGADLRVLSSRWHQMEPHDRINHPYLRALRWSGGTEDPIRPLRVEGLLWRTAQEANQAHQRCTRLKWPWFYYKKGL